MTDTSPTLSFRRLDVYKLTVQWIALAARITAAMPRGHAPLADQLRRAATSIALNIAEAAGRPGDDDGARHYGIARGSATECAAILDATLALGIIDSARAREADALLVRIVQMLSRLCR